MQYNIPLFDLNFDEAEEKAVIDTLKSKWISIGPKCEEFENKFAKMLDADFAVSTSNCTTALHLAFASLGIGVGDEVITPSLTFVATVNAIRYVGASPVFCDICSYEDLNIDPVKIEKLITGKTKAIVVMHYGGFAVDMDAVMDIAKRYNLKVVEDSCHGPLSEYKGKKLGTIGDVGCFSFFSNKNISTGEGGMIVTNRKDLLDKTKLLRSHGMTSMSYERSKGHSTTYDVVELGFNFRMDDIRASIGIVQLDKIINDLEKRAIVREQYIKGLKDVEEIIIPFLNYKEFSSNYIFPILLKDSDINKREDIRDKLHKKGIQTSVHYSSVHRYSIYKKYDVSLPITEYVSENIITLPMYGKLMENDIQFVIDSLKDIISNY